MQIRSIVWRGLGARGVVALIAGAVLMLVVLALFFVFLPLVILGMLVLGIWARLRLRRAIKRRQGACDDVIDAEVVEQDGR